MIECHLYAVIIRLNVLTVTRSADIAHHVAVARYARCVCYTCRMSQTASHVDE